MSDKLKRTRVAVVGTGVGGISACYNIWKQVGYKCEVEVFEPSTKVGDSWRGVKLDKINLPSEIGVPVTGPASQPEFFNFIRELGVKRHKASKSIKVGNDTHFLGGASLWKSLLAAFFSAPSQTLKLFWTLLFFFRSAWKYLKDNESGSTRLTLKQFAQKEKFSSEFINSYLLSLANAVHPSGSEQALDMDAYSVLRNLADNCLLSFTGISWYAFNGQELVDNFMETCEPKVHLQTPVNKLRKNENGRWCVNELPQEYDAVVLSLDPSLSELTLTTDSPDEETFLSACKAVKYEEVVFYFHEDLKVMPADTSTWASTNVSDGVVTFWENQRQNLGNTKDIFSTVVTKDAMSKILVNKSQYLHQPVTRFRPSINDHNAEIHEKIKNLSGTGGLYACGSAFAFGPYEDQYKSGVAVANIHSDKAIPLVRKLTNPIPRPVLTFFELIKSVYLSVLVKVFCCGVGDKIKFGSIGVLFPNRDVIYFGTEKGPTSVLVKTVDLRFPLFGILFGEWGWSESYVKKWICCNNFTLLTGLLCKNLAGKKNLLQRWTKRFRPPQTPIFHNYDHIGDFFGCILDESKTFSVALFDHEDEPMEVAQYRKLDRLIDSLTCLTKDSHVLELGAGWGSLAVRLVQRVGCKVTCVTTSPTEPIFELAEKHGVADRIDAVNIDILDIPKHFGQTRKFDAIVMIEVIEETDDRKYDPYFKVIGEYCREGGQLAMQISCGKYDYDKVASDIARNYTYPGDPVPTFDQLHRTTAKHGFVLTDCHRITENYIYVARNWMKNFIARTSGPNCPFDVNFKFLVHGYLQLLPAMPCVHETHTYQVLMDKLVFDPRPMY